MKGIINIKIYDYVNYIENGFIIFSDVVIALGPMGDFEAWVQGAMAADADEAAGVCGGLESVEDGDGRLLLPGFINFHTHAYAALVRGFDFKCSPASFTELLQGVWWRWDRALGLKDIEISAEVYGRQSLRRGVVALVDHHASGVITGSTAAVRQGFEAAGIMGLTCFETSDRFNLDEAIGENRRNLMWHSEISHSPLGTYGLFGMHASMSLSDKSLCHFGDGAEATMFPKKGSKVRAHVHISESLDDHHAFAQSPTRRLYQEGLLGPGALLAHCVYIDDDDAGLIQSQGAVVALCPKSNANNGVGSFNYKRLRAFGIPLVVGTDGLGVDMARAWQDYYYSARLSGGMTPEDLRRDMVESFSYYETISGRACGRFVKDYCFDAILLDYQPFTPLNGQNVFEHLLFGAFDHLEIDKMWIGGKGVIFDEVAEGNLAEKAQEAARDLWERLR